MDTEDHSPSPQWYLNDPVEHIFELVIAHLWPELRKFKFLLSRLERDCEYPWEGYCTFRFDGPWGAEDGAFIWLGISYNPRGDDPAASIDFRVGEGVTDHAEGEVRFSSIPVRALSDPQIDQLDSLFQTGHKLMDENIRAYLTEAVGQAASFLEGEREPFRTIRNERNLAQVPRRGQLKCPPAGWEDMQAQLLERRSAYYAKYLSLYGPGA